MLEGVPGCDGTTLLGPVTDEQYQAATSSDHYRTAPANRPTWRWCAALLEATYQPAPSRRVDSIRHQR